MLIRSFLLWLSFNAVFCFAQSTGDGAAFLKQARTRYDAPFTRNLQSFSCAVQFDWKQHFREAVRVGDEGSDEEIARLIQPIRTRVTVTGQSATVSSGISDEEERKLPHGGMAEGLLKHAVQFSLNNWLLAANNMILPPQGTSMHVESSPSGYNLQLTIQSFQVELAFTQDMRLSSESVASSAGDRRETDFHPGPQGYVLASYKLGEDGDFRPGNRIGLNYTYQTVNGFQLPEQVTVNRESHHEVWHYELTGCELQTTK